MEQMLKCPLCKSEYDVIAVLKNCSEAWLQQSWLYFICPVCSEGNHIALETNRISIGYLDGAPAPCFVSISSVVTSDLSWKKEGEGIRVKFQEQELFIKGA